MKNNAIIKQKTQKTEKNRRSTNKMKNKSNKFLHSNYTRHKTEH